MAKNWCYFGCENSLPNWGKQYPHCDGYKQSPININTQKVIKNQELGSFDLINFGVPHTMKMLRNNGHTVECMLKAGAVGIRGGGLKHKYTVLQFHFHWGEKDLVHYPGSEHSLNGRRSPLEMHIVSRRSDLNDSTATKVQDGLAVLGFFIEGVKKDKEKEKQIPQVWESFTDYLQKIPRKGDKVRVTESFSMHQLLKGVDLSKFYRYNGSLTTPPCDEAVVWTIFKDPIRINKDLLFRFPRKISFNSVFRPEQPLNNRVVYSSAALNAGQAGTVEHQHMQGLWREGSQLIILLHTEVNQVKEMIFLLATCFAALLCPTVHTADSSVDWCYHKPACNFTTWPKLTTSYCNGSKQSPIDIVTATVQGNPNLTALNFTCFDDNSTFLSVVNSGDSVVVYLDDDKIQVEGGGLPGVYNTKQFHLHWGNGSSSPGSEHTVDGKQYPMELHIVSVHSKYNGNISAALAAKDSAGLAVLGFFIEGTNEVNKTKSWDILTSYLTSIPTSGSQTSDIMNQITLDGLLEGVDRTKYYRYQGSLTTPNCNEAVIWTVFKEPVKVSHDFISRFSTTVLFRDRSTSVLNTNNFRGVQPLNGRVVTTQVAAPSSAATSTLSFLTVLLLSSLYWLMNCLVICFTACLLHIVCGAPTSVSWCYDRPSCSDVAWPIIAAKNCNGTQQSPINIVTANIKANANLTSLKFTGYNDKAALTGIKNTGTTIEVALDYKKMHVEGGDLPGMFSSTQFHLHWGSGSSTPGSEHSVDGKRFPMELHIVNMAERNGSVSGDSVLAALGIFIEASNDTGKPESWKTLTSYLTKIANAGDKARISDSISMDDLLPGVDRSKYYRYLGSLTTPNCDEGVVWTIFKDPLKVSSDLIDLFTTTVHINQTGNSPLISNTFRGVQAINGRVVMSQVARTKSIGPIKPKFKQTSSAANLSQALISPLGVVLLYCLLFL
ncbi:uncharacterized protein LOC122355757 [Puntigrus tetrazona]|uniref:uncharacterized protein LOC122355757 n=1 Tax=Puntigrus tetrazona TaxID=1606681 RepID=UPI001C89BCBB|nr:uncharacterized protein LOC122355757 [Puntigrus tetrazona]